VVGWLGPHIHARLIGNGEDRFKSFVGYLIGAGVMVLGGVIEIFLGAAERRSLEDVARPISSVLRVPDLGAGGRGAPGSAPAGA
jgi:hypothetical protein